MTAIYLKAKVLCQEKETANPQVGAADDIKVRLGSFRGSGAWRNSKEAQQSNHISRFEKRPKIEVKEPKMAQNVRPERLRCGTVQRCKLGRALRGGFGPNFEKCFGPNSAPKCGYLYYNKRPSFFIFKYLAILCSH